MPEINVYIPTHVYLHPSFTVCVFSISYYGTVYLGVCLDLSLVASGALAPSHAQDSSAAEIVIVQ